MPAENLKIHFIGIGGIGVSALAQYYLTKGHQVSGSDLVSSEITQILKKKGVRFGGIEYRQTDMVVYSPAVPKDNPELKKARKLGIRCLSYPQALGELTKQHFTIAVSGMHGKSTTAAMIGLLLTKAGFDPTVIVGTKVKEFGNSNFRAGERPRTNVARTLLQGRNVLIIEADEHFASFLNYWPKIIVLTNIEKDHLDYYKNLKNILKTFKKYIGHLPKNGVLVANRDDKFVSSVISTAVENVRYYSLRQKEAARLRKILKVPGDYNVYNALAALTAARVLKIPDKISYGALAEYRGSWRRFEISHGAWNKKQITVVSDYAHHPTEIRAALKAAREKWPKKEIWCVFQPHQHQRTFYLFDEFVDVFKKSPIDKIIVTDIYDVAGREKGKIKRKVNSKKIAKAANSQKIMYLPKNKIIGYIENNLRNGQVIVIMGAGDIYKLVDLFHRSRVDKKQK